MENAEVYLLHFDDVYWGRARHYVGYTKVGVEERLRLHRNGQGSLLVKYALQKGLDFILARVWLFESVKAARKYELSLKKGGHLPRYCPECKVKNEA